MITTIKIIDRLNEFKGWTDYRTAKMLEVNQTTVSHYRCGKRIMSDEVAVKAADLLGLPRHFILSCIQYERAMNTPLEDTMKESVEIMENHYKEELRAANDNR